MPWFRRKNEGGTRGAAEARSSAEVAPEPVTPVAPVAPEPPVSAVTPVPPASPAPAGPADPAELRERIVDVLKTVYDPEIPVNIYEIGLVYRLDVTPEGQVGVQMTLTSPMCPVAESLPPEVEAKIADVPGVIGVKLDLVWEPPWNPSMMSEEARLLLNIG